MQLRFGYSLYRVFIFVAAFAAPAASEATCINKLNGKELDAIHLIWNGDAIAIVPAFEDYSQMLFDACAAMDLQVASGNEECTIYPMMGDLLFNALATECDGSKLIVYDLTPTEGAHIMALVETCRRTFETTELESRVTALEAKK